MKPDLCCLLCAQAAAVEKAETGPAPSKTAFLSAAAGLPLFERRWLPVKHLKAHDQEQTTRRTQQVWSA